MRPLALVALVALPGCFTTWAISAATLHRPLLDENAREARVPLAGVEETLAVDLYLLGVPPPAAPGAPASSPPPKASDRLELQCRVVQIGKERRHRAATWYGRGWKWSAGISFLVEGALGGLLLAAHQTGGQIVGGALLGLDALGSGVIFFLPRRDVYEEKVEATRTTVREDCPEGLLLDVEGRVVPVDAAGRVSELGQALFVRAMVSGNSVGLSVANRKATVDIKPEDRCAWARRLAHASERALCANVYASGDRLVKSVVLTAEEGTFTPREAPTSTPSAPPEVR